MDVRFQIWQIFVRTKEPKKKFSPICQSGRDFCEKIKEVMTVRTSNVFTRKAVVDETFIKDSPNFCKWIVRIDASQLYPFSICQDMSTGSGGAKSVESFLHACKASETKRVFPLRQAWKSKNTSIRNLFSKLRNSSPVDQEFKDYQNLGSSDFDKQKFLKKLQVKTVPSSGQNNYKYLQKTWQKHEMITF